MDNKEYLDEKLDKIDFNVLKGFYTNNGFDENTIKEIKKHIIDCKSDGDTIEISKEEYNRLIINEIVLWKINRLPRIHPLSEDKHKIVEAILEFDSNKDKEDKEKLLKSMLECKGLGLPVASAILHFYYPETFPIIDQRACREAFCKDDKDAYKTLKSQSIEKLVDLYEKYISKLWELSEYDDKKFENIDKVLYQIDKNKKNKIE